MAAGIRVGWTNATIGWTNETNGAGRVPSSRNSLTLLLIQARDEPHILDQELACFAERCHLRPDQFKRINVVSDAIDDSLLEGVSGVVIGGAGRYSAANDYSWTPSLLRLITGIDEGDLPLFGSCWGHQVIARALGGEVIHDLPRAELGCFAVELTEAGRADPIFSHLPESFLTNMGHHDRVIRLPDNAIELARNQSQPNQAFRIRDRPIYGTQFHSELSAARERERLLEYRDEYRSALPTDAEFEHVVASLSETTEADELLRHFVDTVVLRHEPIV